MNKRKLNTAIKVFIPFSTPSLGLSVDDGAGLKTEVAALFFIMTYA
jgi:hypothetical protein